MTPLRDAGFTKAQVRAASHAWGLPTWDKPAAACLSSRVAYGIEVSPFRLARVERAEAAVRAALDDCRDRRTATCGCATWGTWPGWRWTSTGSTEADACPAVLEAVRIAGFEEAELDPSGFRSGSMNELLPEPEG